MRLNRVTVPTTDIDPAIDFYLKLGLELIVKSSHYASLLCPAGVSTFSIHLHEKVSVSQSLIYFETEYINDKVDNLVKMGLSFESMPADQT